MSTNENRRAQQGGRQARILLSLGLLSLTACTDPFTGSRLEINPIGLRPPCDFAKDASFAALGLTPCQKEPDYHYEMFAVLNASTIARVAVFTVRRQADFDDELGLEKQGALLRDGSRFIISLDGRPYDQLDAASQEKLRKQFELFKDVNVLTSFSKSALEADNKTLVDDYYVGNYYHVTTPRNGVYYGPVSGTDPATKVPIGGATLQSPVKLNGLQGIFVTFEKEVATGPEVPIGPILVAGDAAKGPRGVIRVDAYNAIDRMVQMIISAYPDLGAEVSSF